MYNLKPKFKIGDFVRYGDRIDGIDTVEIENEEQLLQANMNSTTTIWKPIKDECCWLYDKGIQAYAWYGRFVEFKDGYYWSFGEFSIEPIPWDFCEPFLNKPPRFMR